MAKYPYYDPKTDRIFLKRPDGEVVGLLATTKSKSIEYRKVQEIWDLVAKNNFQILLLAC
jgi:hypothetical protein